MVNQTRSWTGPSPAGTSRRIVSGMSPRIGVCSNMFRCCRSNMLTCFRSVKDGMVLIRLLNAVSFTDSQNQKAGSMCSAGSTRQVATCTSAYSFWFCEGKRFFTTKWSAWGQSKQTMSQLHQLFRDILRIRHWLANLIAGFLNDLYTFDPTACLVEPEGTGPRVPWTNLSGALGGKPPSKRSWSWMLCQNIASIGVCYSLSKHRISNFLLEGCMSDWASLSNAFFNKYLHTSSLVPITSRRQYGMLECMTYLCIQAFGVLCCNTRNTLSFWWFCRFRHEISCVDCCLKYFLRKFLKLIHQQHWITCATVVYNDLYSFDPAFNIWSKLSPIPSGSVPTARYGHGFTAAADNMIYLFGGVGSDG